MIRSSLCDYSDPYILLKEIQQLKTQLPQVQTLIIEAKKVVFKNCAPFTDCISEIKNKEIDHAKKALM